jgi:hypothetical protein
VSGATSLAYGVHVVTWLITDNSANTASETQTITLTDGDAPSITAPANVERRSGYGLVSGLRSRRSMV